MARRVLWSTAVVASTGCHPNDGGATDSSSIGEKIEIDASHLGEWNVSVELPSLSLCSGCDLTIDWSELTTDLVGDTIDPSEDATHLSLYVFDSGSHAELVEGLVAQTLDQSQMMARWTCPTSNSQALLSDCAFVGHSLNPEEYFVEDWGLWLLLLHGGSPSRLRTMAFLTPTEDAVTSDVVLSGQSARLNGSLNWADASPLRLGQEPSGILDWSALEQNSWSAPIGYSVLDSIRLDRLEGSVTELGASRDSLDVLSQQTWTAESPRADSISLTEFTGDTEWTGVDESSTWLMTGWCSSCDIDLPIWSVSLRP